MSGFFKKIVFTGCVFTVFFSCTHNKKIAKRIPPEKVEKWACVYSAETPAENFSGFDLLVLDADAHPDLKTLRRQGAQLFGYISLAEVGDYRWYWPRVANQQWILDEDRLWHSRRIDIRSLAWQKFMIRKVIPPILKKGFHGLFLDTIDTAEFLETRSDGLALTGAQKAMADFIRRIRRAYPDVPLIANRGFAIFEEIRDVVDGVLAESVLTAYDFNDKTVRARALSEYEGYLDLLLDFRQAGGLVLTLDYVAQASRELQSHIARLSMSHNFIPYGSTPDLTTLYK